MVSFFPWFCPEKRGRDSCSSHWGRSFVPRLLASEALDHRTVLALPRDRRFLTRPQVVPPRGAVDELNAGVGRTATVPLRRTTPPEVLFLQRAPARPRAAGTDQAACVWRPSRTSGLFRLCEGATWRRGMFGTHGERPQGAQAEPGASVRGGAGPRDGRTARKRGPGAGFRAPRGRLAETKLSNRRGERHRPWLGRGRGELLLSPDWWTEGAYHRRLPPPEPFAGFHSLDPEPPLDFHLLWRENNPLLPLIGFVVEGWD